MPTAAYPEGSIGHALQSGQFELIEANTSAAPTQSTAEAPKTLESPWLPITHDWQSTHQNETVSIWGTIFRVAPDTGAEIYLRIGRQEENDPASPWQTKGVIMVDTGCETPRPNVLEAVLNAESTDADCVHEVLNMQLADLATSDEPKSLIAMRSWDLYTATLDREGRQNVMAAPVSVQLSLGLTPWRM